MTRRRHATGSLRHLDRPALELERRRLIEDPAPDERAPGTVAEAAFACRGDAGEVLGRVREMMLAANRQAMADGWPGRKAWADLLAPWFEAACVDAQEWLARDAERRAAADLPDGEAAAARFAAKWTVDGWLRAMHPNVRGWIWREGEAQGAERIRVSVERLDSEAGLPGEVLWLFHAAGACGIAAGP